MAYYKNKGCLEIIEKKQNFKVDELLGKNFKQMKVRVKALA